MNKKKHLLIPLTILAVLLSLVMSFGQAERPAGVQAQAAFPTPTPDEQGNIYYIVQEGDSCTRVSLLVNVPIDTIISLNGLDDTCVLITGTKILIGKVEAPALTQIAMPTATIPPERITPTVTPAPGFAKVCVVLFNDLDGTGMRTDGETYLFGGVVSLNERSGALSLTGNTVAGDPDLVDPLCFEEVPQGNYNITVAIPDGFNPTTITNYALEIKAGEQATVDFGAQAASAPAENADAAGQQGFPVVGIIGLVILAAGLGLGFYLWRQRKI